MCISYIETTKPLEVDDDTQTLGKHLFGSVYVTVKRKLCRSGPVNVSVHYRNSQFK